MTHTRLMEQALRLQAQAYRALAIAYGVDPHLADDARRRHSDHLAELSAKYEALADSYARMENAA
jgi:hypothetical protein